MKKTSVILTLAMVLIAMALFCAGLQNDLNRKNIVIASQRQVIKEKAERIIQIENVVYKEWSKNMGTNTMFK